MPSIFSKEEIAQMTPEQKQVVMDKLKEEMTRRGMTIPGETAPRPKPGFMEGLKGATGGGFMNRLGSGLKTAIEGAPAALEQYFNPTVTYDTPQTRQAEIDRQAWREKADWERQQNAETLANQRQLKQMEIDAEDRRDQISKQIQAELDKAGSGFKAVKRKVGDVTYELEKPEGGESLSPSLEKYKNEKVYDILSTFENNAVKKDAIASAKDASQKIITGYGGKLQRGLLKAVNPNDPVLGYWQMIKSVLTDAQLLYTAKTKGAISDREMELFAKAAANDDIASLPELAVVFDKLSKFLVAEENAKANAFKKIYNEDPREWDVIKTLLGGATLTPNSSNIRTLKGGVTAERVE